MLTAAPAAARHMISEEPPAETNGIGTPMTGSRPTTTAMLTSPCPTSQAAMQISTIEAYRSRICSAMAIRHHPMTTNSRITSAPPMNPVSSQMIAKMKSLWAAGR